MQGVSWRDQGILAFASHAVMSAAIVRGRSDLLWELLVGSRTGRVKSERDMSKKLFVGSLAWAVDDHGLRAAFERFGEVTDAKVITERDTGRSRGFGFVTFADAADADRAMEEMNGATIEGRPVNVNEARERSPRGGGGGGGGYGGGGRGGRGGRGRDRDRDDRW